MAGLFIFIAVQIGHDRFFQFILVARLDDAVRFASLEIDIDMVHTIGDRPCFSPIHFFDGLTVFIGFQYRIKMCIRDRSWEEGAGILSDFPFNVVLSPVREATGWEAAPADAKEFILLLSGGLIRRPALILKGQDGIYDRVAIYKAKKDAQPLIVLENNVFTPETVSYTHLTIMAARRGRVWRDKGSCSVRIGRF